MDVTAVVLAGGQSRRLGRDKAVEPIAGQPMIARVIERLSTVCDAVVVVVNRPERGAELPLPDNAVVAVDAYPDSGSLGGIFTGLRAAPTDWSLVVACDMPFLNVPLIRYMVSARTGFVVVAPVLDDRPEPTHALYHKTCLPHIEARLKSGSFKITGFYDDVAVNYLSQDIVESFDPDRLSFFNVNTPEDLQKALELADTGL